MSRLEWFHYRATLPADHAYFLRTANKMIEATRLPLHEQAGEFAAIESIAAGNREYVVTPLLFSGVGRVHAAALRIRTWLDCARVGIAAERFRQSTGEWPSSLEELTPEWISEIPSDAYDGQPLRFRRTTYGIVVYAVGADRSDNSGHVQTARTSETQGQDIGFRLWDPSKRRMPPPHPPWFSTSAADAAVGIGSAGRMDVPATAIDDED
jgi:hypothetical protein